MRARPFALLYQETSATVLRNCILLNMISACRRDEVPSEAVEMVDGFALTLVIPDEAWPPGALRLIDVDEQQLFKLALR